MNKNRPMRKPGTNPRRTLAGAMLAAALAGTAPAKAQAKPPNILVIMSDDVGHTNVGAYSHGMMVPTPNIDR
ncbi:MAG: arylsulfatase, partial [Thauera sp.]